MADPLSSIMELIFGANQQAQPLANEIAGKRGEQSAASVDIASLLGQVAEEQNKVYQAEAGAKMQAQQAAAAVRNQLQNNPAQAGSLASTLTTDFVSNYNKAKELRQRVYDDQNINVMNDPLGYLNARLGEDDNIKNHNFFANEANTAAAALAEMQTLTTSTAQAQMASAQTITADSVAAQSAANLKAAQAQSLQARVNAAGYDIQAVQALQAPTHEMVQNQLKLLEAVGTQQRLRLAERSDSREQQTFDWNIALKRANEADIQAMADTVNAARTKLGFGPIPPHQLKNSLATPEGRQQYAGMLEVGSTLEPGGQLNLGATTGDVMLTLGRTGANFNGGPAETKEYLDKVTSLIANTDPEFVGKKLTPQMAQSLSQKLQKYLYGEMVKGVYRPGELTKQAANRDAPGNFLAAPNLADMVMLPAIKALPAYTDAISPLVPLEVKGTGSDIASAVLGWFAQDPSKRLDGAVQSLAGYFKTANAAVYASKGLSTFRMPMPQDYVTEVPSAYSINSGAKDYLDMANPAVAQDWLIKMYAKRRYATGEIQ